MNRLHETQEEARFTLLTVFACEQDFRGAPAAGGWGGGGGGREKKGELATPSLEFEFHHQFPVAPRRTELSDFRESARSGN